MPYVRQLTALEQRHGVTCRPGGHSMDMGEADLTSAQKLRQTASILVNLLRRNAVVLARRRVLALP